MKPTSEESFEIVIEAHLLGRGYVPIACEGYVTSWMSSEAYRRLRVDDGGHTMPPTIRIVEGRVEDRFINCVPLVPLKAAASGFSTPQFVEDGEWDWVEVETRRRLRPGMFVAQIEGISMEPQIPNGASVCSPARLSVRDRGRPFS